MNNQSLLEKIKYANNMEIETFKGTKKINISAKITNTGLITFFEVPKKKSKNFNDLLALLSIGAINNALLGKETHVQIERDDGTYTTEFEVIFKPKKSAFTSKNVTAILKEKGENKKINNRDLNNKSQIKN